MGEKAVERNFTLNNTFGFKFVLIDSYGERGGGEEKFSYKYVHTYNYPFSIKRRAMINQYQNQNDTLINQVAT